MGMRLMRYIPEQPIMMKILFTWIICTHISDVQFQVKIVRIIVEFLRQFTLYALNDNGIKKLLKW